MPYILLNYYSDETREQACRPEMYSETAEGMHKEIRDFVEEGHASFIVEKYRGDKNTMQILRR